MIAKKKKKKKKKKVEGKQDLLDTDNVTLLSPIFLSSLIANDALLWRLTYKLTISGSIFAGHKPLLSPSWIRVHQFSGHEASGFTFSSSSTAHQGRSGSTATSVLPHIVEKTLGDMSDRNEDGLDSMRSSTDERRGSVSHAGSMSSSPLSALASSRPHPGSQSTGSLLQPNSNTNATRAALAIAPGLLMPSPLILPHHRRIAQSMTATNLSSSQTTGITPAQVSGSNQSQLLYFSVTNSTNSSSGHLGPTPTRTPASTPATTSMPSFPSTLSSSVSQVTLTSSTTPIRMIQHHIPSTTLMHHSPAVYWKHQVAEWLEQEKLRCLRLGLFWGFNAAASRAHGRKSQRTL
ncbi:MAG: hypothetical protein JOS17DRAFT_368509 [Linnemannia elongata]|nr:MAG: hypothetical protein JOS17DRAFT_368509 [Linnemannia elongata]